MPTIWVQAGVVTIRSPEFRPATGSTAGRSVPRDARGAGDEAAGRRSLESLRFTGDDRGSLPQGAAARDTPVAVGECRRQ